VSRQIPVDDCGLAEFVTQGEIGNVMVLGPGTDADRFVLEHSDGSGDNCLFVDEADFDCLSRQDEDESAAALGATVVLDIHSSGDFQDADTMALWIDVEATCEGAGCWLVEAATGEFPCALVLDLGLAAQ